MGTAFNAALEHFPFTIEAFFSTIDRSWQTYCRLDTPNADAAETLVVALHGHGSHQEQFLTPGIYGNALGKLMRLAWTRNVLYVAPEYRGNSWMGPLAEADIHQLIMLLRDEFPRLRRVIIIGGSMGGTCALIYAALHPAEVDGVMAACPATDIAAIYRLHEHGRIPDIAHAIRAAYDATPDENPGAYAHRSSVCHASLLTMPIAISHGDHDDIIPVEHSRELVTRLRALGAPVNYIEYPGGDHDAPVPEMTEALAWVLDQL